MPKEELTPQNSETEQPKTLLSLPKELVGYILDFLSPKDRYETPMIDRAFLWPFGSQKYWKEAFERHFPHAYRALLSYEVDFKALFKEFYYREYQKLTPRRTDLLNLIKDCTVKVTPKAETKQALAKSTDETTPKAETKESLTQSVAHKTTTPAIIAILQEKNLRFDELTPYDLHERHLITWAGHTHNKILQDYLYSLKVQEHTNKDGVLVVTAHNLGHLLDDAILCGQSIATIDDLLAQGAGIIDDIHKVRALATAAEFHQLALVEHLLEKGFPADCADQRARSPLASAAKGGNLEIVKILVKHLQDNNKNIFLPNDEGPLHYAAGEGHFEVVEYLLGLPGALAACNYDLSAEETVDTPLQYAVKNGQVKIVRLFRTIDEIEFDILTGSGESLLHLAVQSHSWDMVFEVLSWDETDIELLSDQDQNALHFAAELDHPRIFQLLWQAAEWDINQINWYHRTPLHTAVEASKLRIVRFLLSLPGIAVEPENTTLPSPLYYAAQNGNAPIVKELLKHGAMVNKIGVRSTPLNVAVASGSIATVNALLQAGADTEIGGIDKQTPLHTALNCIWKQGERQIVIVDCLVKHGAKVDAVDAKGLSALAKAIAFKPDQISDEQLLRMIESLAAQDGDINAGIKINKAPIFAAIEQGRSEIALRLFYLGAQTKMLSGETISDIALKYNRLDLLEAFKNPPLPTSLSSSSSSSSPAKPRVPKRKNEDAEQLFSESGKKPKAESKAESQAPDDEMDTSGEQQEYPASSSSYYSMS